MSHSRRYREDLLRRVRKLRGQVESVERALEEGLPCADVLHRASACRGAVSAILAEVLEEHVREHLLGNRKAVSAEQLDAADEVVAVIKSYLK